jgi:hypothetical protein
MVFLYIVRCNFTEARKEQAWNAWYGGPKIEQMLAQPLFRTCQRFRLASGTGRNYLALWTVSAPAALTTPQYTAQWGFAEWAPHITDWSRELFDGCAAPEDAFAVSPRGALHVVSFERMNLAEADAERARVARAEPNLMWLPAVSLDRHTPMIGLRPLTDRATLPSSTATAEAPVQSAMYEPISELHVAARVAHAAS